jgi:hypothetical protein
LEEPKSFLYLTIFGALLDGIAVSHHAIDQLAALARETQVGAKHAAIVTSLE